jgi:tetratricopeptide (TPR) repeat protein
MFRSVLALLAILALVGCGGESAEKYLQEGFGHFQKQEYEQAIQSYQKAIQLEPKAAAAYNMLGMAYRFRFQQLRTPELQEKEIAAFQKSLELDPKYWVAMINLGATYYSRGDKAKAAPLFKQALALNPTHPEKAQIEKMITEAEGKP